MTFQIKSHAQHLAPFDAQITEFSGKAVWGIIKPLAGYDPGQVNSGFAYLSRNGLLRLYQIKIPGGLNSVERIITTKSTLDWIRASLSDCPEEVCVENAAFNALNGQVPLSENRSAAIMAFLIWGVAPDKILVKPPKTVRKEAFGKATTTHDIWNRYMPPDMYVDKSKREDWDCLSALACAYSLVK